MQENHTGSDVRVLLHPLSDHILHQAQLKAARTHHHRQLQAVVQYAVAAAVLPSAVAAAAGYGAVSALRSPVHQLSRKEGVVAGEGEHVRQAGIEGDVEVVVVCWRPKIFRGSVDKFRNTLQTTTVGSSAARKHS